jgi:hypothetical protein
MIYFLSESTLSLKCLWNLCKFETEDRSELLRHIDYHAYHTRLKTFGLGLTNIISIPHCQNDSKFRNVIPDIPDDYVCYWSGCSETYSKFQDFVEHITYHLTFDYENGVSASRNDRANLCDIKVKCKWDGCGRQLPNIFQLKRHMRSHSNEKLIGCANCGTLFTTKPLYVIFFHFKSEVFNVPTASSSILRLSFSKITHSPMSTNFNAPFAVSVAKSSQFLLDTFVSSIIFHFSMQITKLINSSQDIDT